MPRDVELAAGFGLGAGVLAGIGFLVFLSGMQGAALAALGLAVAALAARALGGRRPRVRERALRALEPLLWFLVAALGLVALQPVPQGGGWTNDWLLQFLTDLRYADPRGIGNPEIGAGWSLLGRPALFNLARLPAELVSGSSYASAEGAAVALSAVFATGAWLVLREIAPPRGARAAFWILPASAYWIHLGAYPKSMSLAVGLALGALGLALRARRRPRPGLLPLAATLGALAGVAHPVAAIGLIPPFLVTIRAAARRELVLGLGLVLLVGLPWPIWAVSFAGRSIVDHDPIRRHGGSAPLARGLKSLANISFNMTTSLLPGPLVGHAVAVATGAASPSRKDALELVLETELNPFPAAAGLVAFALFLVRRRGPSPIGRPRLLGAVVALLAAISLAGGLELVGSEALARPVFPYAGYLLVDKRPLCLLAPCVSACLCLGALAFARRRPGPALRGTGDVVASAVVGAAVAGLVLHELADVHGVAHNALAPAVAVMALWIWTEVAGRSRWLTAAAVLEGTAVLVLLGAGAACGWLRADGGLEQKKALGLVGLHDTLGSLSWLGLALIVAACVRCLVAIRSDPAARRADGASAAPSS